MDRLRSVPEILDEAEKVVGDIDAKVDALVEQRDLWKKAADVALKHNGELRLQIEGLNRDLAQAVLRIEELETERDTATEQGEEPYA